jgi:hypothetical protein
MEKYYFRKLNYIHYNFIHNKNPPTELRYFTKDEINEMEYDANYFFNEDYNNGCLYTQKPIEFITYERFKVEPPFSKIFFKDIDSILNYFERKYKIPVVKDFVDYYQVYWFPKEIWWDDIIEIMTFEDFMDIIYPNLTTPLLIKIEKPKNNLFTILFNIDFFEGLDGDYNKFNIFFNRAGSLFGEIYYGTWKKDYTFSSLLEAQIYGLVTTIFCIDTTNYLTKGQQFHIDTVVDIETFNKKYYNNFVKICKDYFFGYHIATTVEGSNLNLLQARNMKKEDLENNFKAIMSIFSLHMLPFEIIFPTHLD